MKEIEIRNDNLPKEIRHKLDHIYRCTYQFEYQKEAAHQYGTKDTALSQKPGVNQVLYGDVYYVTMLGKYLLLHIPTRNIPFYHRMFYMYLGFTDNRDRQLFSITIYDKDCKEYIEQEYNSGGIHIGDVYIKNIKCVMILYDNILCTNIATLNYHTSD
jgi:hypothetical protein